LDLVTVDFGMTLYRWHLFGLPEIDPNLCSENHYAISWSVPKDRFFHSGLHPDATQSGANVFRRTAYFTADCTISLTALGGFAVPEDRFFRSGLHPVLNPHGSGTVQDDRFFYGGLHPKVEQTGLFIRFRMTASFKADCTRDLARWPSDS
jgi:hypothetical protein